MSYEPVLGIDLGASYTKVSIRGDPLSTDEPAEMVATALGAASIILDAEEPNPQPTFEPKQRLAANEVYCRCNGGNKDCCRCFGRGYYRKIERF